MFIQRRETKSGEKEANTAQQHTLAQPKLANKQPKQCRIKIELHLSEVEKDI